MSLAFVDTELVSAGRSAAASCALALATKGGIVDEPASSFRTASASAAFFFIADGFGLSLGSRAATFTGLRCDETCRFQCRDFLANLFSATGAPAALSVFDAV